MEFILITLLNGLSYGLLLFMLSAGLTLIYSMMGVLNFAHASFYMLGAYLAYTVTSHIGYWPALIVAPLAIGVLGALVERHALRAVRRHGHLAELLFTFGLAYVLVEVVQLIWGRAAVPYRVPPILDQPLFTLYSTTFPAYRGFMMLIAVLMMLAIHLLFSRTRIGLVIRAALTHPQMVQSLGHDVPRVTMLVFGGGCALAALAGVIGGNAFVTEPAMAGAVGSIIFVVVVVGGLGSLAGAFLASLLIGIVQTLAVTLDYSLLGLLKTIGIAPESRIAGNALLNLTIAQVAPILPYLLLIVVMLLRPRGLLGVRGD
ncbi:amino acid/amide ABC transporter membrane protein 1 (HAAT family) [Paucimonas lemoignei]|uniref:Amino acid/amide ABC transporter membrane protein 1 (HAAT family) n=1 Tax=Paucimonas lemoignei TaxID=29443 RepID=A0A4V2UJ96_PAULE|nr:branched-chain amino acid ABC transporter permease [Paucimonas lemoignei]TCS39250.1 amino acid/amide ABC transporter membrane protein 1 (HAAT family) [Paucimonas lemoignei]